MTILNDSNNTEKQTSLCRDARTKGSMGVSGGCMHLAITQAKEPNQLHFMEACCTTANFGAKCAHEHNTCVENALVASLLTTQVQGQEQSSGSGEIVGCASMFMLVEASQGISTTPTLPPHGGA